MGTAVKKHHPTGLETNDLLTDTAWQKKKERRPRSADALRKKFGGAVVTRAKLLMDDAEKPKALGAAKNKD